MSEISELALVLHRSRNHFKALGMQNTFGLTAKESEDQAVAYELARADMLRAQADLNRAQKDYGLGIKKPPTEVRG